MSNEDLQKEILVLKEKIQKLEITLNGMRKEIQVLKLQSSTTYIGNESI